MNIIKKYDIFDSDNSSTDSDIESITIEEDVDDVIFSDA